MPVRAGRLVTDILLVQPKYSMLNNITVRVFLFLSFSFRGFLWQCSDRPCGSAIMSFPASLILSCSFFTQHIRIISSKIVRNTDKLCHSRFMIQLSKTSKGPSRCFRHYGTKSFDSFRSNSYRDTICTRIPCF